MLKPAEKRASSQSKRGGSIQQEPGEDKMFIFLRWQTKSYIASRQKPPQRIASSISTRGTAKLFTAASASR